MPICCCSVHSLLLLSFASSSTLLLCQCAASLSTVACLPIRCHLFRPMSLAARWHHAGLRAPTSMGPRKSDLKGPGIGPYGALGGPRSKPLRTRIKAGWAVRHPRGHSTMTYERSNIFLCPATFQFRHLVSNWLQQGSASEKVQGGILDADTGHIRAHSP